MSTLEVISHEIDKIITHLNEMKTYSINDGITITLVKFQLTHLKEFVDNKIKENETEH